MSDHLSSADAAWLHMDRPTNLMVITSVLLFDAPVDFARYREILQARLIDRYPRFSERVVESRLPFRAPAWEPDPDFALEHHLHHRALPAPGDDAALQELLGDLMTQPLDRSRPLWHSFLVDGYGDGAAVINRMHHCIADGISLGRVMLSLTDEQPDGAIRPEPARTRGNGRGLPILGAARAGMGAARWATHVATSPRYATSLAGAVVRDATAAARLFLTPADAASAIKGDPGISRRVAWTAPLPLSSIEAAARRFDATVNDVVLAGVSGALRHYLQARGEAVPEIQAMVPFNLRPLDEPVPHELGNRFGLVFLPLPVATSGGYRRVREVHRRMQAIKQSREGPVSYALLSVAGTMPQIVERGIVDLFSGKSTAVMTNVPGPRKPVYLAGTPVRTVLIWAPSSGHMGMSVSLFSYRGEVTVGLMVDAALVPDPGAIVAALERELTEIGRLARAHGTRRRSRRPGPRARTTSTTSTKE